jgi:hypothetical protein
MPRRAADEPHVSSVRRDKVSLPDGGIRLDTATLYSNRSAPRRLLLDYCPRRRDAVEDLPPAFERQGWRHAEVRSWRRSGRRPGACDDRSSASLAQRKRTRRARRMAASGRHAGGRLDGRGPIALDVEIQHVASGSWSLKSGGRRCKATKDEPRRTLPCSPLPQAGEGQGEGARGALAGNNAVQRHDQAAPRERKRSSQ